ncbi:MAG: ATPase, T2SS/T4P/T4SS family [Planctomycetota bacterium]
MKQLIVLDPKTGEKHAVPLVGSIFRIGKQPDNDLVLDQTGISRKHCELREIGGSWRLIDLNSRNGTFVNRQRIVGEVILPVGAAIQIGDFILAISEEEYLSTTVFTASSGGKRLGSDSGSSTSTGHLRRVTPPALKKRIHARLLKELDLKHADFAEKPDEELRVQTAIACTEIVKEMQNAIPSWITPHELVKEIVDEAVGLGPLEDLLADETVTEIMVVGWDKVYVERKGKLALSLKQFMDDAQVVAIIRRILAPIGRRIDETTPMQDGRLPDGSRVNAIIPPLALSGPVLTIRKFSVNPYTADDLLAFGTLAPDMANFLELVVRNRANLLISGGTGSGKTTLLNVLAAFIPGDERIVTIEDAAELQLPQEHVVRLESRPPNLEGRNAIVIRDLVRNALRMRPDRIVVGECRGGEALDMLQAMNTGHDGSLTTLHANSPHDAISRLETLVLMAGMELPSRAIREQIAGALDFIVHLARLSDGSRRVVAISAVEGMDGDAVALQELFRFDRRGFDEEGRILGAFVSTGVVPDFVQELRKRGISVELGLFRVPETG